MTCIVGIAEAGKVYLGGDSAGVYGDIDVVVRRDRKVFKTGEFVIGFAGSFRMGQLLAHALSPPKISGDPTVYMVKKFIPSIQVLFDMNGYALTEDAQFLIGFRGKLFEVGPDLSIGENESDYVSIGLGSPYAYGSLYTSAGQPTDRITKALDAAAHFSGGVVGPFTFVETN
jgi:ATP-dependent protease HslVU (ClpYQ) peptidase subunit